MGTARSAVALAGMAFALGAGAGSAVARTFSVGCSGSSGDVNGLITAISQANTVGGTNTVALSPECIYALTSADNNWYGPNGLPAITSSLTIQGNGATIARDSLAPHFRLLFVGPDAASPATFGYTSPGAGAGVLTLEGLTLSGGIAEGGHSDGGGGGAGMGGAIFNQGEVTILDSTITNSHAVGGSSVDPAAGYGGGGIGSSSVGAEGGGFGAGSFGGAPGAASNGGLNPGAGGGAGFTATDAGVEPVMEPIGGGAGGGPASGLGGVGGAGFGPGGAAGDGSGGGAAGVSESGSGGDGHGGAFGVGGRGTSFGQFVGGGGGGVGGGGGGAGNAAGGGGGVGAGGGQGSNGGGGKGGFGGGGGGALKGAAGASGFGGGFGSGRYGGGGAGMGGAIFNMQGTVNVLDSTIAGNEAAGGPDITPDHGNGIAGAIFNLSGTVLVTGTTIDGNAASTSASEIYDLVYDAHTERIAQVTLRSTILAGGTGPFELANARTGYIAPLPDLGSAPVDASHFDLITSMNPEYEATISGSPLTADPLLGPLGDNGGLTQTMAPAAGSPAIEAGSAFGLATDQRGAPRTQDFAALPNAAGGDGTDIGAVELQKACPGQALIAEVCPPPVVSKTEPPPLRVTLTGFKQSVSRWREGTRAARLSRARRPPVGTIFSFRLSAPATVQLSFFKKMGGRRLHGRCAAIGKGSSRGRSCTRTVSAGTFSLAAHSGLDKVSFAGRLSRVRRLPAGAYTVRAAAPAGGSGAGPLAFTIVR